MLPGNSLYRKRYPTTLVGDGQLTVSFIEANQAYSAETHTGLTATPFF
jgi:hypothetical protein